jgi:peroxiredoxin family protein/TusA-related sulfurtransferase
VGIRGYLAERILRENGWTRLANLSGGYKTWAAATARQSNGGCYRPGLSGGCKSRETSEPLSYAEGSGQPEPSAGLSSQIIPIDACGLQCPGPIMRLKSEMDKAPEGATLLVKASDPGFARDAEAWCRMTGNEFRGMRQEKGIFEATIRKAAARDEAEGAGRAGPSMGREATLVVFSDDFDRALASFVIANGAAASGKKVTMFFTFWGLSVIKRRERTRAKKDLMGRLFGAMLPRHSGKLSLSKMNFGGLGPAMMRGVMKAKRIDQLEEMMAQARASGVHLMACQMSMDIMGVKAEELIEGVEIGGVATYLDASSGANLNLFV